METCYDAEGASESDRCGASSSASCKEYRQGDATWGECPDHDNLWVRGVSSWSRDEGQHIDEGALAESCAAAEKAQGLDEASGGGDDGDGDDMPKGMFTGWRTYGPSCDDSRSSEWFCVECPTEGEDPYNIGTSDIQVWSQCAEACLRWDNSWSAEADNAEAQQFFQDSIDASCSILAQFDANNSSGTPSN